MKNNDFFFHPFLLELNIILTKLANGSKYSTNGSTAVHSWINNWQLTCQLVKAHIPNMVYTCAYIFFFLKQKKYQDISHVSIE